MVFFFTNFVFLIPLQTLDVSRFINYVKSNYPSLKCQWFTYMELHKYRDQKKMNLWQIPLM